MSTAAIISMILIVGTVVGGFIFFLRLAMKKEADRKKSAG
ncbi:MetS family NSS transporter small subunit [Fulvivirga kasyanovii]|uniref:MetS family NSS transporter small subunit n=1 Tax=Fulvivirga kasyanovii TaxID=396812 RepID=A0ABW9RT00_9BACT|nr:MetS family NSS transporter small subunit [Fulvivirga kasyanovii]MTI27299.1 MetS family NSS transporter small subunit [Fulvivirga kasyanovii]